VTNQMMNNYKMLFFLILINDFEVSIYGIILIVVLGIFSTISCACSSTGRTRCSSCSGSRLSLSLISRLIYFLCSFSPSIVELFHCIIKLINFFLIMQLFYLIKRSFNLLLVAIRNLVFMFIKLLTCGEDQTICLVKLLSTLTDSLVLFSMLFSSILHLLDLFFIKSGRRLNTNALFSACTFVFSTYIQHTVCVNIKANLNLRHSARGRWNIIQMETSKGPVILCFSTPALQDMNFYAGLIVSSCRKGLRLVRRYSGIGFYEFRRNSAERFNTKAQRRYIQQYNVINVAAHDSCLNSCSYRNHFIRIYSFTWIFSKEIFDNLLNFRNTCRTTNQDYLIDITLI